LPPRRPGFESRSGHVGFSVDKVALEQVFSKYFGFSSQFLIHRMLHIHHLSFGPRRIGQFVADVPIGLSLTPPQENYMLPEVFSNTMPLSLIPTPLFCVMSLRYNAYMTNFQAYRSTLREDSANKIALPLSRISIFCIRFL
jgi:hypothetical protein